MIFAVLSSTNCVSVYVGSRLASHSLPCSRNATRRCTFADKGRDIAPSVASSSAKLRVSRCVASMMATATASFAESACATSIIRCTAASLRRSVFSTTSVFCTFVKLLRGGDGENTVCIDAECHRNGGFALLGAGDAVQDEGTEFVVVARQRSFTLKDLHLHLLLVVVYGGVLLRRAVRYGGVAANDDIELAIVHLDADREGHDVH
ncbi:hypothetical protein TRSC58_04857 [Trypanosoma rangeli SC58]|uniref:Uncharacterized protein n=1 Tax=Trypanosoma rangeli SC58 TaxID=429131 RepID=A0A061IWD3_TRYRA|nr:hypothetical protein TRSC58_04857 [Trypanosoma rangeli SC58]